DRRPSFVTHGSKASYASDSFTCVASQKCKWKYCGPVSLTTSSSGSDSEKLVPWLLRAAKTRPNDKTGTQAARKHERDFSILRKLCKSMVSSQLQNRKGGPPEIQDESLEIQAILDGGFG